MAAPVSTRSVMRSSARPPPSTTSRARATSGWRRTISATSDGWTNMPRTLVDWSARPSQPRMRWLVRPVGQAPASTADMSPVA